MPHSGSAYLGVYLYGGLGGFQALVVGATCGQASKYIAQPSALSWLQAGYTGHSFTGHSYTGHSYKGHRYKGQSYKGHRSKGHRYRGHGPRYIDHTSTGHSHTRYFSYSTSMFPLWVMMSQTVLPRPSQPHAAELHVMAHPDLCLSDI
jgi:hypothetical protein